MEFRTKVETEKPTWSIAPAARMLFVGSCFADNVGRIFKEEQFRTVVNPYGVIYNPASILHTIERYTKETPAEEFADYAVFTLGTNHVYILNETGEIVDNCQKRPQHLFTEKELSVDECYDYMRQAIMRLMTKKRDIKVIITVSPIRYRKYGYHGSKLSKATLLLSSQRIIEASHITYHDAIDYFPAYEIVNDELRDYRFYKEDMLHPSEQAVKYIYERFAETYFNKETYQFIEEWQPIKEALGHKPFDAESEEYKKFKLQTHEKFEAFKQKYNL